MNLDETFPEELSQQQVMAMVAAAEARKSKMVALMIAIGAHVVLIGGLLFVVFGEVLERQPNLIISAPYTPLEQLKPAKKRFGSGEGAEACCALRIHEQGDRCSKCGERHSNAYRGGVRRGYRQFRDRVW